MWVRLRKARPCRRAVPCGKLLGGARSDRLGVKDIAAMSGKLLGRWRPG